MYYSMFGDITKTGNPYALDLADKHYQVYKKRWEFLEQEILQLVSMTKIKHRYKQLEKIIYYLSEIKKNPNKYEGIKWDHLDQIQDHEKRIALLCHVKTAHWSGTSIGVYTINALFFKCHKIKIRVWSPQTRGEAGHVSVQTYTGNFYKDGVYISIWPDKNISKREIGNFFTEHKALLHTKDEDLLAEKRPPDFKKKLHMFNPVVLEAYFMFLQSGFCKWHLMSDFGVSNSWAALGLASLAYYNYMETRDEHALQVLFQSCREENLAVNCSSLTYMMLKSIGITDNFDIGLFQIENVPPKVNSYYKKALTYLEKIKSCRIWTPEDIKHLMLFLEAKEQYLKCTFDYFTQECYEKKWHSPWYNHWQKASIDELNLEEKKPSISSPISPPEDETSTLKNNGCALL